MSDNLYADPRTGLPVLGDPAHPRAGTVDDSSRNAPDRVLVVLASNTPEGNALVEKWARMIDTRVAGWTQDQVLKLVRDEPHLRNRIAAGWEGER